MCHGEAMKAAKCLANKSIPPTPDLITASFKRRLDDYPGVIVSSIMLCPNGDLMPKTLRENAIKLPPHAWTYKDFRDIKEYMSAVILKN